VLRCAMTVARWSVSVGPWHVEAFVNGLFRQNCYLAIHETTKRSVVIDPGGEENAITALIEQETAGLDAILLTHGHFDHIGAVDALAKRFNLRARAHVGDRVLIRQASIYASRLAKQSMRPPSQIDYFEGADQMTLAGEVWRAHLTPGHTKGCVCFETRGLLFVGDVVFFKSLPSSTYPGSDSQEIRNAVSTVLSAADPGCVIFSGHGRVWSVAEARDWWHRLTELPPSMNVFALSNETRVE
jgi:hydroxyacylglutathione hydrolase